jgi:hypothetical protein
VSATTTPTVPVSTTRAGWRYLLAAALVGLGTGVLTQVGQSVLPDGWSSLANSITPWLFVAFLLGSRAPGSWWAVAAGPVALLLALVGYYLTVALRYEIVASLTGAVILWIVAAVVGGPVFGLAGRWWRDDRPWHRAVGAGLMGAAAIAEGLYFGVVLGYTSVAIGAVAIGVVMPLVLGRRPGDRVRGLVALAPCVVLGVVGFAATIGLYTVLTG